MGFLAWVALFLTLSPVIGSECEDCLDVFNFASHAQADGGGAEACQHVSARLIVMCKAIMAEPTDSATATCFRLNLCQNATSHLTTSLSDLSFVTSSFAKSPSFTSFLEVSRRRRRGRQNAKPFSDEDKFALKIFWFSIKLLVPCFWMLSYERDISKAKRPESLLELGSYEEPISMNHPVVATIDSALALVETETETKGMFWIFMYIGHWLLRYTHWFSWIIKWRLLRVRHWTSKKHDDPYFLYRPHVSGWGWDARYNYLNGLAVGQSSSQPASVTVDSDVSEFGRKDGTVISSPLNDNEEEQEQAPFPINDLSNDKYYPDPMNNDPTPTLAMYNYYNASDPNYYPGENKKDFPPPVFGQPIYAPTMMLQTLARLTGESDVPSSRTKVHTYSELETLARSALEARKSRTTDKSVASSPPSEHSQPTTNEIQATVSVAVSDKIDNSKPRKHSMYDSLESFQFASKDDNWNIMAADQIEIDHGVQEWKQEDVDLSRFISQTNPVNDPAEDYTRDMDDVESTMANDLKHEYSVMEHIKPMRLGDFSMSNLLSVALNDSMPYGLLAFTNTSEVTFLGKRDGEDEVRELK